MTPEQQLQLLEVRVDRQGRVVVDTEEIRAMVLALLCQRWTQLEIRSALVARLKLRSGDADVTTLVSQVAAGRRQLLRPGRYRAKPRGRRKAAVA
jgi:hypothetical protein